MKKIISLVCVASAFVFALSGCGGMGNQNNNDQNSNVTSQTVQNNGQNQNGDTQGSQNKGQNSNDSLQESQNNSQSSENSLNEDNGEDLAESNTFENGNNGENGRIVDHDGIIGNNERATEENNIFDDAGNMVEDGADRLATAASDVLM